MSLSACSARVPAAVHVAASLLGRRVRCRRCNREFRVDWANPVRSSCYLVAARQGMMRRHGGLGRGVWTMRLCKYLGTGRPRNRRESWRSERIFPLTLRTGHVKSLAELLEAEEIYQLIDFLRDTTPISREQVTLLAPIDQQEVWAAGVTYRRSQTRPDGRVGSRGQLLRSRLQARLDRSCFFKATPHRVVGAEHPDSHPSRFGMECARTRTDARAQLENAAGRFHRRQRREQPRHRGREPALPAPGESSTTNAAAWAPASRCWKACRRATRSAFGCASCADNNVSTKAETDVGQMARSFEDLIEWLCRDNTFPHGVFLLTGTGIVPEKSFRLQAGD